MATDALYVFVTRSKNLDEGILLLNKISTTNFKDIVTRISAKEEFREQDVLELEKRLGVDHVKMQYILQTTSYLLKQLSKVILKPTDLYKQLVEYLGVHKEKAELLIDHYIDAIRNLDLENKRKVIDVSWTLNIQAASTLSRKQSLPNCTIQLKVGDSNDNITLQLEEEQLTSLFNNLENIQGSRSVDRKAIVRERSPHARREESPRNHKAKSFSRSPSRGRKAYRDDDRDRDRRRDDKGERKYNRSRSRSRSEKRYKSSKYSRSRSRSPGYTGHGHSHSHSPMSSRRRHTGTRDNPKPSRCVGVFGLSVHTTEEEIYHIFSEYGPVERVQVVIDAKTGRSRGFSFVYFKSSDDAKVAKEQCSGMKINGKNIRVDFSITERAHTPTPGIYMGKPTYKFERYERRRDDYYGSGSGRSSRYYRRSPSPYYRKRRYERSRSRSYSPRRY